MSEFKQNIKNQGLAKDKNQFENRENFELILLDDKIVEAILYKEKGDDLSIKDRAVFALINNDEISELFVVESSKSLDGTIFIYYLTNKNKIIQSIHLNPHIKEIKAQYTSRGNGLILYAGTEEVVKNTLNIDALAKGCGQDTMDCITHAYTEQGWMSVWAAIQTTFIPITGVFIAGVCAGKNC